MVLYFSNKNLWSSYFKILVFFAICLFLFVFLVYKFIFLIILIFMTSSALLCFAFQVSTVYKKTFLKIDNNIFTIYQPLKKDKQEFNLNSIKNLRKNGQEIILVSQNGDVYKIKLTYLNASDTKKLVNYLKYHPAIKNKKFFV